MHNDTFLKNLLVTIGDYKEHQFITVKIAVCYIKRIKNLSYLSYTNCIEGQPNNCYAFYRRVMAN